MQAVAFSPMFYSAFCLCPEIEVKAIKVWDQTIAEDLTEALKSIPNLAAEILFYAGLFFLRNWQTAKAIHSWVLGYKIFFESPVSLASFAQVRINLRSPTAHVVHPLLRRLPSRPRMHQSCSL